MQILIYLFFLLAFSFSNTAIASIAVKNPTIQITVPLTEIAEFINPVNPFTTVKTIKPKHTANTILEISV